CAVYGLFSVNCPFCKIALTSKSALVSPRRSVPPRNARSCEENWRLPARESQCTCCSGLREVAGKVNSKSSAASVPASVGDEKVPPATPLNVALPFTRNGRLVGPPKAVTRGRHSSKLVVDTEKCRVDEAA